ncbi:MAG TPA: NAD(P)H-dependent glycerol-3-phosphate dehydrogenase [Candidatus Omnitrophota bacterium]|nr:NAD(P)H-dependent glycerol-3-phosphate dehydrogenase [Candidatus Omnitrophota bacterium]HQJ15171.1 NAD(P)H-dependent glycerol-3-phosphate dehydrogenase [Candidatus Omnitrophota bacterium]
MKKALQTNIAVLGDGGWGTTLAILLANKGYHVRLWSAFKDYASVLDRKRVNDKFLPGIKIPSNIAITADLQRAVLNADCIVLAIPSQYIRSVLQKIKKIDQSKNSVYLSATKGIEIGSLKRMSEVIHEELGPVKLAVLSGPTIAHEVAVGIPSTAVIASHSTAVRKRLQEIFTTGRFRIYTSDDVCGVELGGSLKNVIAIACGISDGLGFGSNTKAALLSRGLAEIARLGACQGAKIKTFSGISGLGDLVTTCVSPYSRNRSVGEQIGKGKTYAQIRKHMQMVAEGVPTARSAYALSLKNKVEMPITREVFQVLYKGKSPVKAVKDLMTRRTKEE